MGALHQAVYPCNRNTTPLAMPNSKPNIGLTLDQTLEQLAEGNHRFRDGRPLHRDPKIERQATCDTQEPFAAVLSCIDSRVPVERVFDQGLGELLSTRVAGNVVSNDILGSLEFGCEVVGAKLIVVMGHTKCRAIHNACDGLEFGHMTALLERIRVAVRSTVVPEDPKQRTSQNATFVADVTQRNIELAITSIRERSNILRDLEDSGSIAIVGALYDIETGGVEFQC